MILRNVRLVYLKEMRDTLRDRRTLFISVVLPILLYPLLMIGFSQVMISQQRGILAQTQTVVVVGGPAVTDMILRFEASEDGLEVVSSTDPERDRRGGGIDAWVEFGPEFGKDIEAGRQGSVKIHYDSTNESSAAARRKVTRVLLAYEKEVLRDRGLSEADIEPVRVEDGDDASPKKKGAKRLGPLLALLLVIMALSGAFYPAVDIMAGEKERGTMETLLVCPATRTEIVAGKYLTVLTMTLVTALLNFVSMGLTFAQFVHFVPKTAGGSMALEISPTVAGIIVLALLPMAGLFSALALALSTFARTYKEGQHYLTPLFVAVMPLAMVAVVPATKLETFALVPVAGVVLLVRDLLLESAGPIQVLMVLFSTLAFASLAIWWTVAMFNREDVLFRDPGGTDFTLLQRSRERGATPSAGQGLGVAAACLALVFFLVPWFLKLPENGKSWAFLFQQIGLVFGLPLLAVAWYRLDLKKTLSLTVPRAIAWPAVLIGAPAMFIFALVASGIVGVNEESLEPFLKDFMEIRDTLGLPVMLLIPPFAEEVMFRGFLLSGFRKGRKGAIAVVLVAIIFALFHLSPSRYVPSALIGLWLGYLVVATGSIYPAIFAHLLNNGIAMGLEVLAENGVSVLGPTGELPAWMIAPAGVAIVAAILILERLRRSGAEPSSGAGEGVKG